MSKKIISLLIVCCISISLIACGPSDEKIQEAQSKYTQLVEIHNQAVEVHKEISDSSLDESLVKLREQIDEVEDYNLQKMSDEEIDTLIQIMDVLITSYNEQLATINDIKDKEDAAVLIPISMTIANDTGLSFHMLKLYEKDDIGMHKNILEEMESLAPGQTVIGLVIQRDVDNTPWILELTDSDGTTYEIELPVAEYGEEGVKASLKYSTETKELSLDI